VGYNPNPLFNFTGIGEAVSSFRANQAARYLLLFGSPSPLRRTRPSSCLLTTDCGSVGAAPRMRPTSRGGGGGGNFCPCRQCQRCTGARDVCIYIYMFM